MTGDPKPPATPQDWETLIDDFQSGGARQERWAPVLPSVVDYAIASLLRKDFPLKPSLLVFLEEFAVPLFSSSSAGGTGDLLLRLLDALRAALQSPLDGPHPAAYHLKEHFMVSATSVFVSVADVDDDDGGDSLRAVEGLVETLLIVINRPNHGADRHARGVACECLRQLERERPCLLAGVVGHVWGLCQSERTHAFQSYLLLFATIVCNIVKVRPNVSILNNSVPLVPFNLPQWEVSGLNFKELRRALAFLLECPQVLTPCGMAEFLGLVMPVAVALELQVSMLKVQFFGMVYSFDPLLCHTVLMMYSHFLDAFDGHEGMIARRLMLISKETQHFLVFRMLVLHWLLGLLSRLMLDGKVGKCRDVAEMGFRFYPNVFDPLALKALKLDLLAFWSINLGALRAHSESLDEVVAGKSIMKLFEDGLVSVSGFKWLPHWSIETAVAFRAFHKFLIGVSPHNNMDPSTAATPNKSSNFQILQKMMVDMTLSYQRLVPVTVSLAVRLLGCKKHGWLGERLLQTVDEYLLPKVEIDYKLSLYFPLFDRLAENRTIPPRGLLDLLIKFMAFLVEKHGPNTGLKSWSQGSKVLGICRTMLVHHYSSRLFLGLTRLLAFTCLFFPDLEVRDNARIYLRMLICVPGSKLRGILNPSEQLFNIAPSPHSNSFFNGQSPRHHSNLNKSRTISTYFHLERQVSLLVKQCWSLSLSTSVIEVNKPIHLEGGRDSEPQVDARGLNGSAHQIVSDGNLTPPQEPLRVMDSKVSEILGILRRHFSCIPDARQMPGLTVSIPCCLRFESEPYTQVWGTSDLNVAEAPAIYAIVLKFSSSAPYGKIPPYRIPFLLGKSSKDHVNGVAASLEIVSVRDTSEEFQTCSAPVMLDLIPEEPTPGFVDVSLEANTEDGQIIRGQLHSVAVGIEDMFLKAIVPSEIPRDAVPEYYSNLFDALWGACSASSNVGRETFPLKGGKGVTAINGTRSVKLLEFPATSMIRAVEQYLEPFVVSVSGQELINLVKDGGVIRNVTWKDAVSDSHLEATSSVGDMRRAPLHLTYIDDHSEGEDSQVNHTNRIMGQFLVLIFLPPRFHLLFQMEVSENSTLVRIRTDRWPCLAYVDDYLEALVLALGRDCIPL